MDNGDTACASLMGEGWKTRGGLEGADERVIYIIKELWTQVVDFYLMFGELCVCEQL